MKQNFFILFTLILAGCGSIPPTKITYYQPKTQLTATATQTVLCKKVGGENKIYATTNVVFTPSYVADPSESAIIDFDEFNGVFNDASIEVDLTSDGRLAAINGSSTGHGTTLLETVTNVVTAAGLSLFDELPSQNRIDTACQFFKDNYEEKPQTIIRTQSFENFSDDSSFYLTATGNANPAILVLLPEIQIGVLISGANDSRISCTDVKCSKYPSVKLINHAPTLVTAVASNREPDGTLSDPHKVGDKNFLFTLLGNTFNVPLFKPSLFGKLEVDLDLGEAGEIKKIKYASGNSESFGEGFTSLAGMLKKKDGPSEYEALKAANDLLYEQQRKIACEANPSQANCK